MPDEAPRTLPVCAHEDRLGPRRRDPGEARSAPGCSERSRTGASTRPCGRNLIHRSAVVPAPAGRKAPSTVGSVEVLDQAAVDTSEAGLGEGTGEVAGALGVVVVVECLLADLAGDSHAGRRQERIAGGVAPSGPAV